MPVEPYPDILKNIRDTLNVIGPQVHQIAEASDPGMARLNLLMAIIAAVAGSLGTVFGFFSYWYSKKTAKNVARTNAKNRLSVSKTLIQTVYKRMCYVRALIHNPRLISQNLLNNIYLPDFADCFILEDYRNDSERYRHLLSLKRHMVRYDDLVERCIENLDRGIRLTERDCLDLLETPVKILIELHHLNNKKRRNYADILLNEIVSLHFVNVHFAVEEGRNEIEGIPVLENDTGVMLLERLVHAGSTPALNGSLTGTAAVEERRNLELLLTNSAANKAIALLDAYALNPGKQLAIEWLSCAWSIDSSIVENQFMRYYGSSV